MPFTVALLVVPVKRGIRSYCTCHVSNAHLSSDGTLRVWKFVVDSCALNLNLSTTQPSFPPRLSCTADSYVGAIYVSLVVWRAMIIVLDILLLGALFW